MSEMHSLVSATGCDELAEVRVDDLRLAAMIGAHPHEQGRRQNLCVSIAVRIAPVVEDRLEETVDYVALATAATQLADEHISLIEIFARRLALACVEMKGVVAVKISVAKPGALPNGTASASCSLERVAKSARARYL